MWGFFLVVCGRIAVVLSRPPKVKLPLRMTALVAPTAPGPSVWDRTFGLQLTAGRQLARAACLIVFITTISLLLELVVVSNLQQRSAQQRAFDAFRSDLATGTAPVGPADLYGPAPRGRDAGRLPRDPRHRAAPGRRRGDRSRPRCSTGPATAATPPCPGQAGTSMILGRRVGLRRAVRPARQPGQGRRDHGHHRAGDLRVHGPGRAPRGRPRRRRPWSRARAGCCW